MTSQPQAQNPHPAWRRARCEWCRAGRPFHRHSNRDHHEGSFCAPCTAPTEPEYIAELEQELAVFREADQFKTRKYAQAEYQRRELEAALTDSDIQHSRINAELTQQLAEARAAAAVAYQFCGAFGGTEKLMDNLSAIAQGKTPPHAEWPTAAGEWTWAGCGHTAEGRCGQCLAEARKLAEERGAALARAMSVFEDLDTCTFLRGQCPECLGRLHETRNALLGEHGSNGHSAWLQSHDDALIERCANTADKYLLKQRMNNTGYDVAAEIRALKGGA